MEYNENDLNAKIAILLDRSERECKERASFRTEILNRLGSIEEQTKRTNGRVSRLEEKQETQEELNKQVQPILQTAKATWFSFKNVCIAIGFLLSCGASVYAMMK